MGWAQLEKEMSGISVHQLQYSNSLIRYFEYREILKC